MSFLKKKIRELFPFTSTIKKYLTDGQFRDVQLFHKTGKRFVPRLDDFPRMVRIETTTRCNLACSHCPNSVLSEKKGWSGDLDTALFKKAVDEVARERPDAIVRTFGGGEPLMRKDMEDLILYCKDQGLKFVSFNTNGHLLTEKRSLALIKNGLDGIDISIDAMTAATYEKIRNSKHFDSLLKNVHRFIELKSKFRPKLEITVSYVKQKDNLHEVDNFIHYWKDKVDRISMREYHQHHGLVDKHGDYGRDSKKHRHPCTYPWQRIIVHHDGKVKFCEFDWEAVSPVGDISTHTLREIWHSDAFNKLRQANITGNFKDTYCEDCQDWQWLKW